MLRDYWEKQFLSQKKKPLSIHQNYQGHEKTEAYSPVRIQSPNCASRCISFSSRKWSLNSLFRALEKRITQVGPCTRLHGSKGQKAYNAYPIEVVCATAEFMSSLRITLVCLAFFNQLLLVIEPIKLLPTDQNYKIVHTKYCSTCMEEARPSVQYRSLIDTYMSVADLSNLLFGSNVVHCTS